MATEQERRAWADVATWDKCRYMLQRSECYSVAVPALLADLEAAEAENATLRQTLAESRHRKAVELWGAREIKRRIREAVAAEREACAKVCDKESEFLASDNDGASIGADLCAYAIRARGNHA